MISIDRHTYGNYIFFIYIHQCLCEKLSAVHKIRISTYQVLLSNCTTCEFRGRGPYSRTWNIHLFDEIFYFIRAFSTSNAGKYLC